MTAATQRSGCAAMDPSEQAPTGATEQDHAAAVSVVPPPLLIVEGDNDIAGFTAQVLTDAGYVVTHAASPHIALALFTLHGPRAYRLVLSDDFHCDRAQAYVWLDRLRNVTTAPIVIWSAAPRAFYADYHARGYAGFLPKPFELRDLLLLMAGCLSEPRVET